MDYNLKVLQIINNIYKTIGLKKREVNIRTVSNFHFFNIYSVWKYFVLENKKIATFYDNFFC